MIQLKILSLYGLYIMFWIEFFVIDEYYLTGLKTHVSFMNNNIVLGIINKH